MIVRVLLLASVAFVADACPPSPQPPPQPVPAPIVDASVAPEAAPAPVPTPQPEPQPEAGPEPVLDACGRACAVLYKLGCSEAMPTKLGVPCHDVCAQVEVFAGLTMHPGTIAACSTLACVRKAGVACK